MASIVINTIRGHAMQSYINGTLIISNDLKLVCYSKFLQMILTGATNTDIEVCNVDLKSTNETDLTCSELMPLHSSTPQVCFVWRFNFPIQVTRGQIYYPKEAIKLLFAHRCYIIKVNSLMFGV